MSSLLLCLWTHQSNSIICDCFQNYYDAVAMCRVMGGGDLAESVKSFPAAEKYCKRARGGCAPSLVRMNAFVLVS